MKLKVTLLLIVIGFQLYGTIPDSIQHKLKNYHAKEKINFLADNCWNIRESQPRLAIELAQEALNISEKEFQDTRKAEINNYIGAIYINYLHDYITSIPYIQKARELSILFNDSVQLGYAYNNLGDIYYVTNNLPLALKYDSISYHIFTKLDFKRGIAYSLTNLGEAYLLKKEFNKALDCYQRLFQIETATENKPGVAFSLLEIGQALFYLKKYDEALNYFNKAYDLSSSFNNKTFKSDCLNKLASISIVYEQYEEALQILNEAIDLNIKSGYMPGIINNKIDIALLLSKINQLEESETILDEAIDIANNLGFHAFIIKTYKAKSDIYVNGNNIDLAIKSYKKYISVYDSLYSIRSFETLNELQKSFQSQLTIDQIRNDLEIQKQERFYLLIIIGLFLAIGAIVFWRFKTISKLNAQLSESNLTKDKLFSIVAHDLKSPFNTIIGFSEMMKDALANKEFQKANEYLTILNQTSNNTYNLITNLLDWSRTQQNKFVFNPTSFDFSGIIDEIINLKLPEAQIKNINFDISKLTSKYVYADRNSVYIIFSNLISNAIKFTPSNGRISFETEEKESTLELKVIDNGIGIQQKDVINLFNLKNSNSTPGTNNEKGTGLGLLICKELVERNKGIISVKSKQGEGSTFIVTLPAK